MPVMPPTAARHAEYKQILRECSACLAAVGGELVVAHSEGFACGYAVNTDEEIDPFIPLSSHTNS